MKTFSVSVRVFTDNLISIRFRHSKTVDPIESA